MTSHLLSPRAVAAYLPGVDPTELRAWRKHGWFPNADARIGVYPGWSTPRLDHFVEENMAQARRCFAERGGRLRRAVTPEWWAPEPVRFLGLADIAEAAGMTAPALWSHYYKGRLSEPDVTIGHNNRVSGWTPERARDLAAAQGWHFNLARLADRSGLGGAL